MLRGAIDVEPGMLLKLFLLGDADGQHVGVSARKSEVVEFVILFNKIDLFEVLICQWVDFDCFS